MEPNEKKVSSGMPVMKKKIGSVTYIVKTRFKETASETMEDKIKRMIQNEIRNEQS